MTVLQSKPSSSYKYSQMQYSTLFKEPLFTGKIWTGFFCPYFSGILHTIWEHREKFQNLVISRFFYRLSKRRESWCIVDSFKLGKHRDCYPYCPPFPTTPFNLAATSNRGGQAWANHLVRGTSFFSWIVHRFSINVTSHNRVKFTLVAM